MADDFSPHRRRMRAIAYRMLGSLVEAGDVVQDAYLRWHAAHDRVETAEAWLTTTVTRLCLDRLKSARHTREVYVGPWLPEPAPTEPDEVDPESVSLAFLVLLERLSPTERAVYLLHSVFEHSHEQIAEILGKSPQAVRQVFHRAKQHVAAGKPRFAASREQHQALLGRFLAAVQSADLAAVEQLLAADVQALTDGGGKARAARNVVQGRNDVARFFIGVVSKSSAEFEVELLEINGLPSAVLRQNGLASGVVSIETDGHEIRAVHVVLNPDKLRAVPPPLAN